MTLSGRVLGLAVLLAAASWAQAPVSVVEQPDAQRTRQQLSDLLRRYPPALGSVLALDSGLLSNQAYLAPYPALTGFLSTHPEIVRNPSFYVGVADPFRQDRPSEANIYDNVWEKSLSDVAVLAGFSLAICLIAWLIRTFIDYRRWTRLSKIQTDAHTKLLDRFSNNEDLLAYVNSPAGSKFLESSPIALDAAPRSVAAPLGRILWTVQGGVVLIAAGVGLDVVGRQSSSRNYQPLHALGTLGIALGCGFVISAIISYMIARRLGLFQRLTQDATQPPAQG